MSIEDGKGPNPVEVESLWENRITIIPENPGHKKVMISFEFANPRERFAFQKAAERILKDTCRAFNQIPPESGPQGSTAWELWYMPPEETPETMLQKVKEEMPKTFELYDQIFS